MAYRLLNIVIRMFVEKNNRITCCILMLIFSTSMLAQADAEQKDFPFEPLRDPFWPVGYFPDNWLTAPKGEDTSPAAVSDWDAPAALIKVTGVSRMGVRTAAIINGDVKAVGDLVEIRYSGRVYQWKLLDVQPDGRVKLERFAVKADSSGR